MKLKIVSIALLALFSSLLQAETIDAGGELTRRAGAAGTSTSVCLKKTFIKRNSGTFVTGLSSSKIVMTRVVERSADTTVDRIVSFRYSLTASTSPSHAGLYDLCVIPSGFTWKRFTNYTIDAIVDGVSTADHGIFQVSLFNM